jgi:hypothetical protein
VKKPGGSLTGSGRWFVGLASASLLVSALSTPAPAFVTFEDVTARAGLAWEGPSWSSAWADFDGDGKLDLWVGNHGFGTALYRNLGDGRFEEEAQARGLRRFRDPHGAAWADFDGDGDQDLVVLEGAMRGQGVKSNALFVQTGGVFVEEAIARGVNDAAGRGRVPLWLDQDGDGILDLVVTNAARAEAPSLLLRGDGNGRFQVDARFEAGASELAILGPRGASPFPLLLVDRAALPAAAFDLLSPCCPNVAQGLGLPARGLRMDALLAEFSGQGRSSLVTASVAWASDAHRTAPRVLQAHLQSSGGVRGVELVAGNAPIRVQVGSFVDGATAPSEIFIGASGRHPDAATFTLDPTDPVVAGSLPVPSGSTRRVHVGFFPASGLWRIEAGLLGDRVAVRIETGQPISTWKRLGFSSFSASEPVSLHEEQNGVFVDRSAAAGLGTPRSCTSVASGDFDNDGDLDLYLVCTTLARNLPNVFLENDGHGSFREVTGATGAEGPSAGLGDHASVADFDGDGFLDLFVANGFGDDPLNRGPNLLLRNRGNANRWVQLDLVGSVSNRDAIGARVAAFSGSRRQLRVVGAEMRRGAQDMRRLHFGLAAADSLERLRIEWPSGLVQVERNLAAGQVHRLEESRPVARGDVLLDGRVTVVDALLVLRSAVGGRPCSREVCDVDSNGAITASDAHLLAYRAVGL